MKRYKVMAAVKVSSLLIITILLLNSSSIFSQEYQKEKKGWENQGNSKQINSKAVLDSTIIRTGQIDLVAIDENMDGKVFQDQMDWNVISDKPGKCPLCDMKLEEVTLDVAKENLLKNNLKVK